jgi:hypothetical protein
VTCIDERNQMRRALLLAAVAAITALAATAPAAAKGPSSASLTGPGLDHALPVTGNGEGGPNTPLGSLVQFGGFFPQMFAEVPDPTTRTQPTGDLGPRYRVSYRVPGPNGISTVVQDVYPYAKTPVTYMSSGQRFWGGNHTHGGWFLADARLKEALVAAGLRETPLAPGGSFPWAWTLVGIAVLVVLLALALRRRDIARLRTLKNPA